MKKLIYTALLSLLLIGCAKEEITKKDVSVLVIGNSITMSNSNPDIGWNGNCGMAASSIDKDFCSQLRYLLLADYKNVNLDRTQLAWWESNFSYDYTWQIDLTKSYDYIVIELGENVSNYSQYKNALNKLIADFKTTNSKIILVSNAWHKPEVDNIEFEICQENNYQFCDISAMYSDSNYYATEYENQEVAAHPNNEGMMFMANSIYLTIKN
jgi:alpha-galactosidase